jgi:hypothetical protein
MTTAKSPKQLPTLRSASSLAEQGTPAGEPLPEASDLVFSHFVN